MGSAAAWGGSSIHPAALLIRRVFPPLPPANHWLIRQMGSSTAVNLQAPLRYEWVLGWQSLPFLKAFLFFNLSSLQDETAEQGNVEVLLETSAVAPCCAAAVKHVCSAAVPQVGTRYRLPHSSLFMEKLSQLFCNVWLNLLAP